MLISCFSVFTELICSKKGRNTNIPLQNVTSLLHTNMIFIFICSIGIVFTPFYIKTALGIGLPFLILGYFISKNINYKAGGFLSIAVIYLICSIIILEIDKIGYFSYLPFCWITITIFIAIIFLSGKQIFIISILPYGVALLLFFLSENITFSRLTPWFIFNLFFAVVCISTKEILLNYRNQLEIQNEKLEQIVQQRTGDLSDAIEEKDILIKELYHRTRNNMQVISSLLSLQMQSTENQNAQLILSKTFSRINAMSLVHDKLYSSQNLRFISFKEYLIDLSEEILNKISGKPFSLNFFHAVEDLTIPLEAAIPLGLVINELLTNIAKHSSVESDQLILKIEWSHTPDNNLLLNIHNDDKYRNQSRTFADSASLSLSLVKNLVEGQLNGTILFESESDNLLFKIRIPILSHDHQEDFSTNKLSV